MMDSLVGLDAAKATFLCLPPVGTPTAFTTEAFRRLGRRPGGCSRVACLRGEPPVPDKLTFLGFANAPGGAEA